MDNSVQPCKVSRKVRQVRQVCGRETGDGNLQECLECRCADLDGWETGGMSTLKTRKTASRTGTRLRRGWGRQLGQLGTTLFQVRRPTRRRPGARASRPRRFWKVKTCRNSQCFPQSPIQRRGWTPPHRKPRVACSEASAPLPGVRHPAAPLRMPRGRDSGRREPQGEEAAWRAWWRMVRSSSFRPSSGREVRRPCRWRVTLSRRAALPASVWIAYCLASSRRMTNSLRTSDGSVAGGAASRSADSGAEGRPQEAAEKRRAAARAALHGIRLATAYSAAPPLTTR